MTSADAKNSSQTAEEKLQKKDQNQFHEPTFLSITTSASDLGKCTGETDDDNYFVFESRSFLRTEMKSELGLIPKCLFFQGAKSRECFPFARVVKLEVCEERRGVFRGDVKEVTQQIHINFSIKESNKQF